MNIKRLISLAPICFLLAVSTSSSNAWAHDVWNNGRPVPEWVKRACCGPMEAHNLREKDVKLLPQGYEIVGWPDIIPYSEALPSPDGTYWAFYENYDDGNTMNCFFAPNTSF